MGYARPMTPFDDEPPRLPPYAPLDKRILAGAVDLLLLGLIVSLYFTLPLLFGGLTLPMWGVFAAVLGYAVAPLALFRATVGMRLFGVELLGKNGHPAQLIDLVFRELIGRGFFPAAYLSTLVAAVIAGWLGILRFAMPSGAGGILLVVSVVLLAATSLGHFLVFTRPDRRSLADLVAKTVVVTRLPRPVPEDEDERQDALRAGRGRVRNLVITEAILLALGVGLPWSLTQRTPGEHRAEYADRLTRTKLQHQFDRDPADRKLARELQRAYQSAGDYDRADAVTQAHREALAAQDRKSEESLRARVGQNPEDLDGIGLLVELLDRLERPEDAETVYRDAVDAAPTPERRMALGIWLMRRGESQAAEEVFTRAIDEGLAEARAYTWRGHARAEQRRFAHARADFLTALELDPDHAEADEALVRLDSNGLTADFP